MGWDVFARAPHRLDRATFGFLMVHVIRGGIAATPDVVTDAPTTAAGDAQRSVIRNLRFMAASQE